MADSKISNLPLATTPLAGTEVLPIVQGGTTSQVTIANVTAGRSVSMSALTVTGAVTFSSTGAIQLPVGTTAQEPSSPTAGLLRFNSSTSQFEGYNGSAWASVGGAALSNDTTTATAVYPLFAHATTGTALTIYTSNANYLYTPSTGQLQAPFFTSSATITGSLGYGAYNYGTLGYSDTGIFASYTINANSYGQVVLQNTNTGTAASVDFVVSNDQGAANGYYGDFGMNSSIFSGTGSLGGAGFVYLYSQSTDLAIGTWAVKPIHFVIGNSATDAMTINTNGAIAVNGSYGTSGQTLITNGSGSAPTWGAAPSVPALNVVLQQNFGGFL